MAIDRESVRSIVHDIGGVAGVGRLAREVMVRGLVDEEWRTDALERLIKAEIRKVMREGDEGEELPPIVNVVRRGEDGGETQVYVQRELMEVADYEYAVDYRVKMAGHFADSARAFADECRSRHGVQIPLPGWMPSATQA